MIKSVLVAALLAALTAPALAQTSLDQSPSGLVRGIESQNTSGQVGEVLLKGNTLSVAMKGTNGKPETVTLNRGFECSDTPGPVVSTLGTLTNGNLSATASMPVDRLLSGNYVVVVHNNGASSQAVACGHLYRQS